MTPDRGPAFSLVFVDVLSIGQLAEAAGVHIETIRYCERRGLLPEPPRTEAGYRQHGTDDLWRLQFVGRAKALGFTLSEVGELLTVGVRGDPGSVRIMVRRKLEAIEERQRDLAEVREGWRVWSTSVPIPTARTAGRCASPAERSIHFVQQTCLAPRPDQPLAQLAPGEEKDRRDGEYLEAG